MSNKIEGLIKFLQLFLRAVYRAGQFGNGANEWLAYKNSKGDSS